jgi:hypothetical protein
MLIFMASGCGKHVENICGDRMAGPLNTLWIGNVKFVLDDKGTNLGVIFEISSDITDDACVLISLIDDFVRTDSSTIFIKGYQKGFSISDYSIRTYARMPMDAEYCDAYYTRAFDYNIYPISEESYSGMFINNHKILVDDATPLDFPVYIKKIHLKKGVNNEKVNIKFEQPLEYPINNPSIRLHVLRINDRIKKQIEGYPSKYEPCEYARLLHDMYFKTFPDSSLTSFVFSSHLLMIEMSRLTGDEWRAHYDATGLGDLADEYCNYAYNHSFTGVYYQLYRQGDFDEYYFLTNNE